MDHVKKKALILELPFLIFMLFIGWKLRSRNFCYVMDISEILILTAVLKIMPLLELSVNDLTAVASFMLANKVVLQFLYIPEYKHSRIIPFSFLLLLELFVLVRGIHHRKRGYGIAVGYAVLCCMVVLSIYQKCEQSLFLNYLVRGVTEDFVGKKLCLLAGIAIAAVSIFLMFRYFSVFIKKWLINLQEYSVTYTEIDRSIMLVMILTLCCLMMTELLPLVPEDNTFEFPLLWIGLCAIIVMIQVVYIRLLAKSISVKEEMRLQKYKNVLLNSFFKENEFHNISQSGEWNLNVVNRWNVIPEDYSVTLTELSNGQKVDSRIYPYLQEMFDEMRAEGIYPIVRDGYRTAEEQEKLFNEKVQAYMNEGYSKARAEK